jgi:hypothetical protein
MKKFLRGLFSLLILVELVSSFALPNIASDFAWLGLVVTAGFVWAMLEIFDAPSSVWILALIAILLDGASALLLLYSRIDSWDRLVHTFGGLVIAAGALDLALRALRKGYITVLRRKTFVIMTTLMTVASIGFLYEFLEYLVDQLYYHSPKTLVSAYDSIEDQLFNLLGGVIVLTAYFAWNKWRERKQSAIGGK